jgi:hypothetical protein
MPRGLSGKDLQDLISQALIKAGQMIKDQTLELCFVFKKWACKIKTYLSKETRRNIHGYTFDLIVDGRSIPLIIDRQVAEEPSMLRRFKWTLNREESPAIHDLRRLYREHLAQSA